MSIEGLSEFFTRLQEDDALREQAFALEGVEGVERRDGLCRLAAEHGFDVTPADWEHEAVGPAVAAFEDDALRDVVGGLGCGIPGYGVGGQHGPLSPG